MTETARVLLLDDEPNFPETVASALEKKDDRFEVKPSTHPAEALDLIENQEFDCVVLDYEVPGYDGIELLDTLREEYPDLPVILYTGKGSEEIASTAMAKGVTDYVPKEADDNTYSLLADRINNAIEHQQARSNYEQIFESIPDGIVIHDPETFEFVDMNRQYVEMFGYDSKAEFLEAGFDAIQRGEPPYTTEKARELVQTALEDGPKTVEWPGVRKDGSDFWAEVHLTPIRIDGTQRILAVVRNVTERVEQAQELERSEKRFRTLAENFPNGAVLVFDSDLRYQSAYGEGFERAGFDPAAFVDQHISDVFDGETLETKREMYEATLEGEAREREMGFAGRVYRVFTMPIRDESGEISEGIVMTQDVTEYKEREEELERYKAYLEETRDIITVFDDSGTVTYESPAVERILGYEQGTLVGENGFDFVHPDDRDEVAESFSKLVSEPGETAVAEYRFRTADDEWRWLEARGTNQLEADPINGIVTSNRDITERKQREQDLIQQNKRLDKFAGIVSHDLRNPLTVAEGRLELARNECETDHHDAIATALDRMHRIIEDVLWLAREGQDIGSIEPVALGNAVESAWEMVAEHGEQADLRFATDQRQLPTIEADYDRFCQLLENLFKNAIQHGGEEVTVTVGESEDGFYIEDDGPGIPRDERGEVFDPGYSTSPDGTGFGLSIVKDIADAHGWAIRVTEGSDGGARFEITGVEQAVE